MRPLLAVARCGALLAAPLALSLLASACVQETRYARPSGPTTVVDPGARANLRIDLTGNVVLRSGVLILPLRIENAGDRAVRVVLDRCEVEETSGSRRPRHRSAYGELQCLVPTRDARAATLVFGETTAPLSGDTFRVYLWIEDVDGSGLIDGIPPLLVSGKGSFDFPPRPLAKDLRSPAEAYPPSTAQPPALRPDAVDCPHCSAPRTGTGPCPYCGLPP